MGCRESFVITSSHPKLPWVLLKEVVKMGFIDTPDVGMMMGQDTSFRGRWEEGKEARECHHQSSALGILSLTAEGNPHTPGQSQDPWASAALTLSAHASDFSHPHVSKDRCSVLGPQNFRPERDLRVHRSNLLSLQLKKLRSWGSSDWPGDQKPSGNTCYYLHFCK